MIGWRDHAASLAVWSGGGWETDAQAAYIKRGC